MTTWTATLQAFIRQPPPGLASELSPALAIAESNGWLFPLDLDDLVGLGAAGGIHLDLDPLLLADQGARQR